MTRRTRRTLVASLMAGAAAIAFAGPACAGDGGAAAFLPADHRVWPDRPAPTQPTRILMAAFDPDDELDLTEEEQEGEEADEPEADDIDDVDDLDEFDEPDEVDAPDDIDDVDDVDDVDDLDDLDDDDDYDDDLDDDDDEDDDADDDDDDDGEGDDDDDDEAGDDDDDNERTRVASRGPTGLTLEGYDGAELPDGDNSDVDERGHWVQADTVLALDLDDTSAELIEDLGFRVEEREELAGLGRSIARVRAPVGLSIRRAIRTLRDADPETAYDFNHLYSADNDAQELAAQSNGWALQQLGLNGRPQAPLVRVGLIDTAVDPNHPSLAGTRIVIADFVETEDIRPTGHGTAVASLLVGSGGSAAGILTGAELVAAGVFHRSTTGNDVATAERLVRALDWLAVQGVPAVNMSLSGPPNSLLEQAVAALSRRGHVITAAVGNAGPAAPPLYPAAYPDVVAVTALDLEQRIYRRANRGTHVDFAAPGVNVRVADTDGTRQASGTSFAAPYVTAIIALGLPQPDPGLSQSLLQRLERSAVDMGRTGHDPVFGHGLVQVPTTLQKAER